MAKGAEKGSIGHISRTGHAETPATLDRVEGKERGREGGKNMGPGTHFTFVDSYIRVYRTYMFPYHMGHSSHVHVGALESRLEGGVFEEIRHKRDLPPQRTQHPLPPPLALCRIL